MNKTKPTYGNPERAFEVRVLELHIESLEDQIEVSRAGLDSLKKEAVVQILGYNPGTIRTLGWSCPESPIGECVVLLEGEDSDCCLFCGLPDERL